MKHKLQFLSLFQNTAPGHFHEGHRAGRDGVPAQVHLPGRGGNTDRGCGQNHQYLKGTRNRGTKRGQGAGRT